MTKEQKIMLLALYINFGTGVFTFGQLRQIRRNALSYEHEFTMTENLTVTWMESHGMFYEHQTIKTKNNDWLRVFSLTEKAIMQLGKIYE